MYQYIWLVPLLPLAGAAINGIFGRWFRFPEKLIGSIAVGSVALSFLISVAAIYSYGFGGDAVWPNPYVATQTAFTWIPGGTVKPTLGTEQRTPEALQKEYERRIAELPPGSPMPRNMLIGINEESKSSLLNIEWSYQLDPLSAVFMLIVTGVGLCIFVFATG